MALFLETTVFELISKQPVYQYYILNCGTKERFQNHTWLLLLVWLMLGNLLVSCRNFQDRLMLFQIK